MTIIRLVNGSDAAVKLSVEETLEALPGQARRRGVRRAARRGRPDPPPSERCHRRLRGRAQGSAGFRMGVSPTGG